MAIFSRLEKQCLVAAVVLSSILGIAVDSALVLYTAFANLAFFGLRP